MILELSPHIENLLIEQAHAKGISPAQLITQLLQKKAENNTDDSLMATAGMLKDINGLRYERDIRSEWE